MEKLMKRFTLSAAFMGAVMLVALCGCQNFNGSGSGLLTEGSIIAEDHDGDDSIALFNELGGEDSFVDLAQYLYRWYLDENDFKDRNPAYRGKLWIRAIDGVLDPGDKSRFLELVFPAIGVKVSLKKSDYTIEELKLKVKSDGYKITKISRAAGDVLGDPQDYASLDLDVEALYEKLFSTRLEAEYPDDELFSHLRSIAAEQCAHLNQGTPAAGTQTVWVAPISPLANEIWMYWENRKVLFRFVSDIDIKNKGIWNYDSIFATSHDIITQTIVSYEEAPGEDSFMTRDQVGRVLYNCMAFGKKITIELKK